MSKEDSYLYGNKEEIHEPSIATSTSTSYVSAEVTLSTRSEPHSNSNFKSISIYFEDINSSIICKGINRTLLQGNTTQCTPSKEQSHEARVLKVSSEINIVGSMNFDDYPQLYLSSIHNNSQDD